MRQRFAIMVIVTTVHMSMASAILNGANLNVPGDYSTIHEAVDAANDGDHVVVAPGVYVSGVAEIRQKSIQIRSSGGAAATTIDCQLAGGGIRVYQGDGVTSIDGFTLIGSGEASGMGPFPGISVYDSSAVIKNCNFYDNWCAIQLDGGGANSDGSSLCTISNCQFDQNHGGQLAGGIQGWSGMQVSVDNCAFVGNTSSWGGGAVYFSKSVDAEFADCVFSFNEVHGESSGSYPPYGGAFAMALECVAEFTRCTFESNKCDFGIGGAVRGWKSNADFVECNFFNNTSEAGFAIVLDEGSAGGILQCLFSDFSPIDGNLIVIDPTSSVSMSNTAICGAQDEHISGEWIDGGGNCITFSCGDSNENGFPDSCECLADTDGSGQVGAEDVAALVAWWGSDAALCDFDFDGSVGVRDLLFLLENWGSCV